MSAQTNSSGDGAGVGAPAGSTGRQVRALQPQREMLEAIRDRQFALHYQPIVRFDTCEISGVEALLRWEHPVAGMLPPDDFLTGIAQTPVMREITRHVLGLASSDAARWPDWTISVNVAATDVVHPRFVDDVTEALETAGMSPARLTLELTEQSVVQDFAKATAHLQRLRDLGVGVALDDFGTGYSSLLYLRELPITQVKIDRVFVSALGTADEDTAIVESVVRLARSINLEVVAEGVELPAQARFLQGIGCSAGQGFLFARPMAADDLGSEDASGWTSGPSLRRRRGRSAATTHDPTTIDTVRALMSNGASLHTIAAALNRNGALTSQGTRWTARTAALLVSSLSDD